MNLNSPGNIDGPRKNGREGKPGIVGALTRMLKTEDDLHGYTVHQRYQSFIVQLMHIHSLLKQLKL